MWPNPQETADLVTFTGEILNEKYHFLSSVMGHISTYWKNTVTLARTIDNSVP